MLIRKIIGDIAMYILNLKIFHFLRFLPLTTILIFNVNAFAASPTATQPDPRLSAYSKIKGTNNGRMELDRIGSQGLAASPANVKLLREALASRASDDERAIQVATLGAMWNRKNTTGSNDAIKSDLRKMAQAGERNTARAAVFALSRMGDIEEELTGLLQQARDRGHIDNDEHAGELARSVRFAPKERQLEFVSLISKSNSKYGIDVLTSELNLPSVLAQYSPQALAEIDVLLGKSEPSFPFAIGEFGLIDAMRYTGWLLARAAIYEKRGRGAQQGFILSTMNDPKLDPRKAMGYLSSPAASSFLSYMSRKKLEPVEGRIRTYADSLPQSRVIQETAEISLSRINTLSN